MSDPILPPPSPPSSYTPPAAAEEMTPQEIEQGKVLAALGYPIGIIAIVMFFVRNNRFSLFHAKQMVTLIIIVNALTIPFVALFCILSFGLGMAGAGGNNAAAAGGGGAFMVFTCVFWLIAIAISLAAFVLVIMGLINAIQGRAKPLPFVGGLAEKWFKNVRVKA